MNLLAIEWFVSRVVMVGFCALVTVALTKLTPRPPAPEREEALALLVTGDEIAAYKRAVLEAAATPSTRCTRPVLRGAPAPGNANADVLALAAPGTPIARCLTEWTAVLSDAQRTPGKLAVLEKCGAVLEAGMRAAISHEDACSPYRLGGPPGPVPSTSLFIAQALGERARVLADAGDAAGAMWLLLEVMRLGQDRARGRTDLMASMIGSAIVNNALDHATAILDKAAPANVDELIAGVDALLASEPSFGDAAASDAIRVALDGISTLDASWVPPGGTREGRPPPAEPGSRPWIFAVDVLVLGTHAPGRMARLCPADASLAQCRRNLDGPYGVFDSDGTTRTLVRQALVESLMGSYFSMWPAYVDKRVITHGALIALRLKLAVAKSGCGDRAALAKLATTPTLGDAMRLEDTSDGIQVKPPVWVADRSWTDVLPFRIRCTP